MVCAAFTSPRRSLGILGTLYPNLLWSVHPPFSAVPSLDFIASYTTRTTPGKAADFSTAAESIQRPSLRQNQSLP